MSQLGQYVVSPGQAQNDHQSQNLSPRQELDTTIPPVNWEAPNLSVPQEIPGQLGCDQIQRSIVVPQQLPPEHLAIDGHNSSLLTDTFNTETTLDLMGVGTDTFFNLDLLDWGILDNSFVAHRDDSGTVVTCSETSNQQTISPEATASPYDFGDNAARFVTPMNLPSGMSLMQISPLEAHCSLIIQYLREASQGSRRWDHWFSMDNMSRFLRSYFESFHQHTPLLHLPFWNISITSTRLILAMTLIGAVYSGDLKANSSDARRLCHMAQAFAWSSDPCLQAGGPAQLDTIHSVYIVTLLEAFYLPFKRCRAPVDTKRLVNEARNTGVFVDVQPGIDPWKMKWEDWSAQECRIRTAFILYLFDAIRAIMFDQRPELHSYELRLPLPCDENIFAASTEDEWQALYVKAHNVTRMEFPAILSLFLCHSSMDLPLDFSVMGAFIVLHGILLHMWEQKLIFRRRDPREVQDPVEERMNEHLADAQSKVTNNALRLWRKHWARTVDSPGSMTSKGLYRDRALAYWYLGNLMNHNRRAKGLDVAPVSINGNWSLKVPRLLRKLTTLMDDGQLDANSDYVISAAGENLDRQLGDIQEMSDENIEDEEMDTIILGCMMRKERQSRH
ncbi:uncharacterized protein PV07_00924 [Cladophialophora immunda]|uniref:Xylanolytic transcriptional activator regulatory domain-containing protein n=1 Tax=Cladophialophora immunda TaxID=569365 RepID=A0A0D2CSH0_9EURO|nr:uncharacterized protein PV07_00924 [Cladophialophora immunda]KIW34128.1 hypothetical protein PV07_00924 [Cladophialophora immunda]